MRLWPYPRANGDHTIDVLRRLRAAFPDEALLVLWDGAPSHRAQAVREAATALTITLMPLPGDSPDLMPWKNSGAGCARTSPIITATPAPTTSPDGWRTSRGA